MKQQKNRKMRATIEPERKRAQKRFREEVGLFGAYAPYGVSFHEKTNPVVTAEESK